MQTKQTPLRSLCEIQFGINKPYSTHRGEVHYIQVRDIDERNGVEWERTERISALKAPEKKLLQPGDVLFSAKGTQNIAVALEPDMPQRAVASSAFLVLRPTHSHLHPDFLQHYLNSKHVQHYFERFARHTTVRMIGKKELMELQVPLPSYKEQELIVEYAELVQDEAFRLELQMQKRQQQLESIFHNLAKSEA